MWPFSKQKELERRLSKYVSSKVAKKILSNEPISLEPQSGFIHLMLVLAKDENLEEVGELLSSISEILMQRDFTVQSIPLSLTVATFGFPFKEPEKVYEICGQTAKDLTDKLPGKLKVLYANASGKHGVFGHPKIGRFGPQVPRFDLMLKQLVELNYGEFAEYHKP